VGDFPSLRFADQVVTVADDLQDNFWHLDAQVITNSFGAYLFWHAEATLPTSSGRVMLLWPIVNVFCHTSQLVHFSPPLPNRLQVLNSYIY